MTQIFYIEQGEYSDYSVYGVTLDRDLAEQWVEHLNRNLRQYEDPYTFSEGWLLDSPPVLRTEYTMSITWAYPDKPHIVSAERSVPESQATGPDAIQIIEDIHGYSMIVSGYDFAEVERVFNERRAVWQPRTGTSSS